MFSFLKSLFKGLFWFIIGGVTLGGIGGAVFLIWGYLYITRDLPRLDNIEDYKPPAVTKVFDSANNLIAEFYTERRYPVAISEIPEYVKHAFIAAEDASFYTHPGIDVISIIRAAVKNLQAGSKKQGASTITQQVVKKLLLTPEKDYRRKIKEAILSYRLEKKLSKDEIIEIYLNQMYFGNGAYGIRAAAEIYFHKELKDLSVAESALLAGLLKAPSRYSPILNFDRAKKRQIYVLKQMVDSGFITKAQMEMADKEIIKSYPVDNTRIQKAPYYGSEVKRVLISMLGSEREVDTGGYEVHTALDLRAEELAINALRKNLKEIDKRRGWRGVSDFVEENDRGAYIQHLQKTYGSAHQHGEIIPALATRVNKTRGLIEVTTGAETQELNLVNAPWMRRKRTRDDKVIAGYPAMEIIPGSIVEVSWDTGDPAKPEDDKLQFDQTPEIEGSIVLIDPYTGKVPAMVGGYDYNRSQFNRVTQSLRQPGSSFKPILYLTALDAFGYTPTTIVYDEPRTFRVGDEVWSPGNFDEKFLGPITLRNALEKSRNLASADIISRIGVSSVISYAKKLGINSDLGQNLSLALGSSEVTSLELTRAYGVLAAKGVLVNTAFVTKVIDRTGKVLFDYRDNVLQSGKQVVDEGSVFVLNHILKGVVQRGTGVRVKSINRPVAGKTGTSNNQMDAWFIGFTPEWVCSVWIGFDQKREIGEKETGGKIAAPVWLDFMKPFLEYRDQLTVEKLKAESETEAARLGIEPEPIETPQPIDFTVPAGVDPYWVDRSTGLLSCSGCDGAILEYFKKGTAPTRTTDLKEDAQSYLESGDL